MEVLPIAGLLLACIALTVQAGPAMRYAQAAADALQTPSGYIQAVMTATPVSRALGAPIPQTELAP